MTKDEIKKHLNSYTKEQIIDALANLLKGNYYEPIILKIDNFINDKAIDAAYEQYNKANEDKTKYLQSLFIKYGTSSIHFSQLKTAELDEYIKLLEAEEEAYKDVINLEKQQEKRLINIKYTKKNIG